MGENHILRSLLIITIFCIIQGLCSFDQSVNYCQLYYNLRKGEFCIKSAEKYFIVNTDASENWFQAKRLCRRYGYLADFENTQQLDGVPNEMISLGLLSDTHRFWIGGNDLGSEGRFHSVATGNLLRFTRWPRGQPDNAGSNEHCVELVKNGMNDRRCPDKLHYICQIDTSKPFVYINFVLQHENKTKQDLSLRCNI